jgi:hypothetical protein
MNTYGSARDFAFGALPAQISWRSAFEKLSMPGLRFGVFDEFKGRRTLLFWGNASGIAALQTIFREFGEGARRIAALHEMEWAEGVDRAQLFVELVPSKWGRTVELIRTAERTAIKWTGTPDEFSDYVDLLAPLIEPSCVSGHQYLDALHRHSPIQIMVSKGEYPEDLK